MKIKKLKILMNLWILTLLGKHMKKADVIKKANLFKNNFSESIKVSKYQAK